MCTLLLAQIKRTTLVAMLISRGRQERLCQLSRMILFPMSYTSVEVEEHTHARSILTPIKAYTCQSISVSHRIARMSQSDTASTVSVGLMHLHALQWSGYSRIEVKKKIIIGILCKFCAVNV